MVSAVPVRIITGQAKGRYLKVPRGWGGRPTSDRVKESLFNILGPLVPGASFLDLFAGTGSVGIEALSRGASRAVFVENDRQAVRAIRENLAQTGLGDRAEVLPLDVLAAAGKLKGQKFNLIFLDPPYGQGLEIPAMEALVANNLLDEDSLVVVEGSRRRKMPARVGCLKLCREHRIGDTVLAFYRPGVNGGED